MSFYGSMKIKHITAGTEKKLELEIRKLEIAHDGMLKVVNVYPSPRGGFTAWYYHDFSKARPAEGEKPLLKKKTTKKKVTKKQGS